MMGDTKTRIELTDVVVLMSRAELEAQREGCEELKLLGELEWPDGTQGPVTLPALEASDEVIAGDVAIVANHVEDVTLHALCWERSLVVWTVDVKVVVDGYLHCVLAMYEPEGKGKTIYELNDGEKNKRADL